MKEEENGKMACTRDDNEAHTVSINAFFSILKNCSFSVLHTSFNRGGVFRNAGTLTSFWVYSFWDTCLI